MPDAGLVTIPDVEVCRVGNWHSGLSGRTPVTADDIAAMIAASTDAEVDDGPLKIGHIDPRFDGEPALGWLKNLRNRDGTLVVDLEGVPSGMEHLVRSAFKRRSAEISWNVKTPSGRIHRAVLSGLALLGVTPPAVKGLADVMSRYSAPQAELVDRVTVIDGDDSEQAAQLAAALNASAAYSAAVSVLPAGTVKAAVALLAGSSGDLPDPDPHAGGRATPTSLEADVTDDELRAALGLAAGTAITAEHRAIVAHQAQVAEKAAAAAQAKIDADAKAAADQAVADAKAKADADAAAAAAAGGPTVMIDKGALEALQADAAQGAEARRILTEQEREGVLTSALSAGRIAPASMDAYRKLWDSDKAGTKTLLEGLPQVYSTVTNFSGSATGTAGAAVDDTGHTDADWDAFTGSLGLKKG